MQNIRRNRILIAKGRQNESLQQQQLDWTKDCIYRIGRISVSYKKCPVFFKKITYIYIYILNQCGFDLAIYILAPILMAFYFANLYGRLYFHLSLSCPVIGINIIMVALEYCAIKAKHKIFLIFSLIGKCLYTLIFMIHPYFALLYFPATSTNIWYI